MTLNGFELRDYLGCQWTNESVAFRSRPIIFRERAVAFEGSAGVALTRGDRSTCGLGGRARCRPMAKF
jgi:hypothetical protein